MSRVRPLVTGLAGLALLLGAGAAFAQKEKVRDIETRPGITTRVLEGPADRPQAAALLMFGGGDSGLMMLENGSMLRLDDTFLIRSRSLFAEQGLRTFVVDVPSDRRRPPYLNGFRRTPEWEADMRALIRTVHRETGLPVWVAGFSMSALGAGTLSARIGDEPGFGGTVMASACQAIPRPMYERGQWPMEKIRLPFLVVQHRKEGCGYCPNEGLEEQVQKAATPDKQVLWFDGGISTGNPCWERSHHGFNGIEPEVVKGIADWIKARR